MLSSTVVIGGGIAGLVAARALAREGQVVTVLDADDLGGAIARRHLDGLDLDVGAEGFATRGGTVHALLTELGVADRICSPEPVGTRVHRPEGSMRIPDGAALGIPTDLADPALAVLGEAAHRRARQDESLPAAVGADATTLGELVRARMGEAVLDAWPRPLVRGVHRLDVDEVPPETLLPGVLGRMAERGSLAAALRGGGGQLGGLVGGLGQVVDALVGDLTTLGAAMVPAAATALERDLRGWRVRTSRDTVIHADRVLLACPPWWWPSGLPEPVAATGRSWPAPRPVDLVTLVLAHDGGAERSGVIVADGGGRVRARSLTFSSAKWAWLAQEAGGRVVLRLTYDALEHPDDDLVQQAVADAGALTGGAWSVADLRASDRTRWSMARSAVEPSMAEHRDTMRDRLAEVPDLEAAGGWLAGTGLAWSIADGSAAAGRLLS
ncbi:protoporphyrinogen/coproporphyrinogen oxidase [Pseudactinotalea suaedae]|uniref:protoporphyrinogen/coproporphyrinogen oxidase n=1 Tax=Pseudactinotalea suaedae TaxID=1524924 RepID=UPI0012E149FE|nr:FAD-dependent oxidoreductase [Pseudactinotalea suaedae]